MHWQKTASSFLCNNDDVTLFLVSPSDHASSKRDPQGPTPIAPDDPDQDYRGGGPQYANPNLIPPEYYTANNYVGVGNNDQYDNRRGPTNRRIPASISSSDNNSDTTYAESGDINNSLRARMQALDNRE